MQFRSANFFLMACFALFITAISPLITSIGDLGHASEYYTIAEYEQLHPEQEALRKTFSEIVSKKGSRVTRAAGEKQIRIAVIYPGHQVSDYWRRSIVAFKARMDEIGLNYRINEFFTKPAVDYRIQEQMIRKSLDLNPDYLIFTPGYQTPPADHTPDHQPQFSQGNTAEYYHPPESLGR